MKQTMENKKMDKTAMVVFYRASGKIFTTMTAMGTGMMRLWCLNNLTKTRDAMIFSLIDGEMFYYIEGKGKDTPPHIQSKFFDGERYADDYAPGILASMQDTAYERWAE